MKRTSIIIFIAGVLITIGCIIYFRPQVNPVDSDPMTIGPNGGKLSEWPIFIGILSTFVGAVFYYVSRAEEKKSK